MQVEDVEELFITGEFLATFPGRFLAQPIVFKDVGLLYKIWVTPATGDLWRAGLVNTAQLVAAAGLFPHQIGQDEDYLQSDPLALILPCSNERKSMSVHVNSPVSEWLLIDYGSFSDVSRGLSVGLVPENLLAGGPISEI